MRQPSGEYLRYIGPWKLTTFQQLFVNELTCFPFTLYQSFKHPEADGREVLPYLLLSYFPVGAVLDLSHLLLIGIALLGLLAGFLLLLG